MNTNRDNSFRLSEDLDSVRDEIYVASAPRYVSLDSGHGRIRAGASAVPEAAQTIEFASQGNSVLRFEPNGDIYLYGRLAENDTEVVDGMRVFLRGHGLI